MDILLAIALVVLAFIIFKTAEAVIVALIIAALAVWLVRYLRAETRRRG